MRGGVAAWLMASALLVGVAAGAGAAQYGVLSDDELLNELKLNRMLAGYVHRNGAPDVAARRFLSDLPPWDRYEVVLYYFDMHKEISFARVLVLGQPWYNSERNERELTDEDIAQLEPLAHARNTSVRGGGRAGSALARAEAAAMRAENAANRVEVAAERADVAANRAEAVVDKLVAHSGHSRRH